MLKRFLFQRVNDPFDIKVIITSQNYSEVGDKPGYKLVSIEKLKV